MAQLDVGNYTSALEFNSKLLQENHTYVSYKINSLYLCLIKSLAEVVIDYHSSFLLVTAEYASEHAAAFDISFHPLWSLGFVCKLSHFKFVQVLTSYVKIENFRTIKLSDKIFSESLFVRNVVMSASFRLIENRKTQRNVT